MLRLLNRLRDLSDPTTRSDGATQAGHNSVCLCISHNGLLFSVP